MNYCQQCGHANAAADTTCAGCGAALGAQQPPPVPAAGAMRDAGGPKPPNHLVWAILSTLLCCLPTGIVAIVFAAQVDGKHAAGDYAGAQRASANAKTWAWVSFGLGLGFVLLYALFTVLAVVGGGL